MSIRQKDPHKRGKAARDKGARAERKVAKILQDMGHPDARRGQVFNREPDIVGIPRVHIEVKCQERVNPNAAYEQAQEAAKTGEVPVVIYKRGDGKPFMLLVRLDHYERLKEIL